MANSNQLVFKHLSDNRNARKIIGDVFRVDDLARLWRNYVRTEEWFNRYAEMTPHGYCHVEDVADISSDYMFPLSVRRGGTGGRGQRLFNETEMLIMLGVSWLHDVGMYHTFEEHYEDPMYIRKIHGYLSRLALKRDREHVFPSLPDEMVELIALICSYHQGKAPLLDPDPEAKNLKPPLKFALHPEIKEENPGCETFPLWSMRRELSHALDDEKNLFKIEATGQEVCPFRIGLLLKFLDGCDYHATRIGNIRSLFHHSDRNTSHFERSQLCLEDMGVEKKDTASYRRVATERGFFAGGVFHFIRNFLIERTLIRSSAGGNGAPDQVQIIIKPMSLEDADMLAAQLIQEEAKKAGFSDPVIERMQEIYDLFKRYALKPIETIREVMAERLTMPDSDPEEVKKWIESDFLPEWDVSVAEGSDPEQFHFEVAKKYIAKELDAVREGIEKKPGEEWMFCGPCPNSENCGLKENLNIPSFARETVSDPADAWNIVRFDPHVHMDALETIPSTAYSLAGANRYPKREAGCTLAELDANPRMLLFGPDQMARNSLARSVAVEFASQGLGARRDRRVLYYRFRRQRSDSGDGSKPELTRFAETAARFFAANGDFLISNLIRQQDFSSAHEDTLLERIASGSLADRKEPYLLCLLDINRIEDDRTAEFVAKVINLFPCISTEGDAPCSDVLGELCECPDSRSRVLLTSSRKPSQRRWKNAALLRSLNYQPTTHFEATEMKAEAEAVAGPARKKLFKIWTDHGAESSGHEAVLQVARTGLKAGRVVELFERSIANRLADNYAASLGSERRIQIMKVAGLLGGNICLGEAVKAWKIDTGNELNDLAELVARGLLVEDGARLRVVSRAWTAGHRRSGWHDRIGTHPWMDLVVFAGTSCEAPALLNNHPSSVAPYLPELARLRELTGGPHHKWDVWTHSLKTLECLDTILEHLPAELSDFSTDVMARLEAAPSGGNSLFSSVRQLLRVSALFHDIGKADAFREEQGKVSFLEHESLGADQWARVATSHGLGSNDVRFVEHLIRNHMRPWSYFNDPGQTDSAWNRFVNKLGDTLPEQLLLFLADYQATGQDADRKGEVLEIVSKGLRDFRKLEDARNKPRLKLDAEQLMGLGMKPGPNFGKAMKLGEVALNEDKLSVEDALGIAHAEYTRLETESE